MLSVKVSESNIELQQADGKCRLALKSNFNILEMNTLNIPSTPLPTIHLIAGMPGTLNNGDLGTLTSPSSMKIPSSMQNHSSTKKPSPNEHVTTSKPRTTGK